MTTEIPDAAFYRLLAWVSPAYPVGAFSYSHGLEYAVEAGLVFDADTARGWLRDVVRSGGARNDSVFLSCAHRAVTNRDRIGLIEVAEMAAASAASAELALESTAQGAAFLRTTREVWPCEPLDWLVQDWSGPNAYPVAIGVAAAGHGIGVDETLLAYLHAVAANLVSAAVRLVPLGQSDGQRIVAALEPAVVETARSLCGARLDDVGTATLMVDHASMKHETQYTRLFRS